MPHLTKIEQLPDKVLEAAQRAYDQILSRRFTDKAIMQELNQKLDAAGIERASMSGFNRYAGRVRAGRIKRPERV